MATDHDLDTATATSDPVVRARLKRLSRQLETLVTAADDVVSLGAAELGHEVMWRRAVAREPRPQRNNPLDPQHPLTLRLRAVGGIQNRGCERKRPETSSCGHRHDLSRSRSDRAVSVVSGFFWKHVVLDGVSKQSV